MIKTTLLHEILVACSMSGLSLPLLIILPRLGLHVLPALIVILTLVYITYLLLKSSSRVGNITLVTASVIGLLSAYTMNLSLIEMGLIAVSLIWIVRSLLNYSSLLMASLDGLICILSVGCALTATILTGSSGLMIWSFFLSQALFVYIPHRPGARPTPVESRPRQPGTGPDRFTQAYRAAQTALQNVAVAPSRKESR